ncbi:MAG: efflux RND transporter periplasmic adaptor subunit [Betaproteobacteria bacterium]|nr:efflux RND transporter periplasmic adaptor subunit [Betaproteobacteria bacterium]
MNKRNLIATAVPLLLLTAVGGTYYWWNLRQAQPEFRRAKIERGAITAVVSATGTVNPVISVQVGSQVSGQIKEIYADFNSPVKKGQPIARIDPEPFQLRVNQAQADLEATRATVLTQLANVGALRAEVSRAKVNLADAERDFQRNRTLFEKNFVSAAALDKARAVFEAAQEQLKITQAQLAVGESQVRNVEAVVKQREAQLSQAGVDLEHTTIRAPVDGVVISRNVDAGQTVAASLQAPTLFVIAQNLTDMQVDTSIDEAEVGRVKVQQAATFTVDSFPGRSFSGSVTQVRKAAQVVQNVVTYTAVVAAPNPDLALFPGMTANVRLVIDTRQNVLKVPNAALRFRPAGVADAAKGGAPAEAEPAGGRRGPGQAQASRERLIKELKLDNDQQQKLDAIFAATRQKMSASQGMSDEARRKQAERFRAESRTRIMDMLNPGQRTRYEEMVAGQSGRSSGSRGRVWVSDADGQPKPVVLRLGLTDGSFTELVGGDLVEGAQVIVGAGVNAGKTKAVAGPGAPPRLKL